MGFSGIKIERPVTSLRYVEMRLELIIGPMFAGKSSTLQSIVRRRQAIGWSVLVVKHTADTRYIDGPENSRVVNHDLQQCSAVARSELLGLLDSSEFAAARLIIVEEGQFFPDIVEFALAAVEQEGKDLVVVGLDGDAHRRPFGRLLELIPLADEVQRLYAFCKMCGDGTPARFTCAVTPTIAAATLGGGANVGGSDSYQPVCRKHFLASNTKT
jgi:thymidine kinase